MPPYESRRFRDLPGGYTHRLPEASVAMQNYDSLADALGAAVAMTWLANHTARGINQTRLAAQIGGGPGFINLFTPPYAAGTELQASFGLPADFVPPFVQVKGKTVQTGTLRRNKRGQTVGINVTGEFTLPL